MKLTSCGSLRNGLTKYIFVVVIVMFIGSINGCELMSRADFLAESNNKDQEEADETMQSIIDALENQDADSLKKLFSTYAVENSEDLDQRIDDLSDYYHGCSDGFTGSYDTQEITHYGDRTNILNGVYTVTNGEQVYKIGFTTLSRSDEEPDKIGLYLIEVMTEEAKPDGFKWKDVEDAPGIYILE